MINHVAIIPDGNRRWAKRRKLLPWQGHLEGAKSAEKILEKALELRIPYFTLWGGSFDNLTQRERKEIQFLIKVYGEYFKRLFKDDRIRKNEVQINVFGKWREIFPERLKRIIETITEKTKYYNRYFLTLLLAYNGTDEILDCIGKILKTAKNKKTEVDENLIKKNLWTGNLAPVDLVIRTGCEGDPHSSAGFMMWQTAYSQYYFTKTLFPDFSPQEFEQAINDFSKRERRFGK